MSRLILRVVVLTLLSALVAACGSRPRQTEDATRMFDVRAIAVTANGGVSGAIIGGVQRQTELAIAATTFAVPKARAVINVHVASVTRDNAGHAQAAVTVTLSDVGSAQPVLVRSYLILASSERARVSDAAIADAIATRLRYEFGLSMPPIRQVVQIDPDISTKLKSETDRKKKTVKPIVVPLKTAPVLGVDQDPVLNSKTKVDAVEEPAKIEPAVKAKTKVTVDEEQSSESEVETGAKVKVVIKPKAVPDAPSDDEPCVETLDKTC
jgi:hypothetical protein